MATQKKLTLKDKASQLLQKAYAKAEAFSLSETPVCKHNTTAPACAILLPSE